MLFKISLQSMPLLRRENQLDQNIIAILPGSRKQKLQKMLAKRC
jgi:lipid A disaccharide synthetase